MGYSETRCHICGVSFNIGRLRTIKEPRAAAWDSSSYRGTLTYVSMEYSAGTSCARDAGCRTTFREDAARQERRGVSKREGSEDRNYLVSGGDTNDDDEEGDGEYLPAGGDSDTDDEDYGDSDGVSEQSSEESYDEMEDVTGHVSDDEVDAADLLYRDFLRGLRDPDLVLSEAMKNGYNGQLELRQKEAPFRRTEAEIMLPLHSPQDDKVDDQTVNCVEGTLAVSHIQDEAVSQEWYMQELVRYYRDRPSHWAYLLEDTQYRQSDRFWEHLAGPGCVNISGYNGNAITVEEMQGCTTCQCLVQKNAKNQDSPELEFRSDIGAVGLQPDDKAWESKGMWFLSGLADHVPSRDSDSPVFFNGRTLEYSLNADDIHHVWDDDDHPYAMPFHPTCLEVYKRACLQRHGIVDIESLANWWEVSSKDIEEVEDVEGLSRSEDVTEGADQWWLHNPGHEYLAANPCLVPNLTKILSSAIRSSSPDQLDSYMGEPNLHNSFLELPPELHGRILDYLPSSDMARLCLAFPALESSIQPTIHKGLMHEHPALWELWCKTPHAPWIGTDEEQLRATARDQHDQSERLSGISEILKDEGYHELGERLKEESFSTKPWPILQVKPALFLDAKSTNFVQLAIDLASAAEKNEIKGFRNRERIWTDCQTLLDRVETYKDQGKIPRCYVCPGYQTGIGC